MNSHFDVNNNIVSAVQNTGVSAPVAASSLEQRLDAIVAKWKTQLQAHVTFGQVEIIAQKIATELKELDGAQNPDAFQQARVELKEVLTAAYDQALQGAGESEEEVAEEEASVSSEPVAEEVVAEEPVVQEAAATEVVAYAPPVQVLPVKVREPSVAFDRPAVLGKRFTLASPHDHKDTVRLFMSLSCRRYY